MRSPDSHKGENGTVAIIGGSLHQHGAPLMSALAAEASGVDLVYLWVPAMHREVAKAASYNMQVYSFGSEHSDELSKADVAHVLEFLATIDAAVIGPGLARTHANLAAIEELLSEIPCPLVADASALQQTTLKALDGKHAVLTPHLGELERMGLTQKELPAIAKKHSCTFLVKSPVDVIVGADGTTEEVKGGNPGLTVGGTGDALAGLTAGLIAQGRQPAEACVIASTVIKRAGDLLLRDHGYAYRTVDVISVIPLLLRRHIV